jgi:plastocyanin domain-containing protein
MKYDGPNDSGLTVMDAISMKISEEYPKEKIYDNKKTKVELTVSNIDSEEYQVVLNFKSHKGEMNYDWNVDMSSEKIISNNQESKYIIDLVDFYD